MDAWHEGRVERLTDPTGWLTLDGLHELKDGSQTLGSDPASDVVLDGGVAPSVGVLAIDKRGISFTASDGVSVSSGGEAVSSIPLVHDGEGDPTVLESGTLLFHVIDREGELFLRVRDRESETLAGFAGIDRFDVDPAYRVVAKLVPGTEDRIEVPNILGQVGVSDSPGILEFELMGESYSFRPTSNSDGSLFIVFGDQTNGRDTYGAGRFLSADKPGEDGTVVLDFNRSYNMVCAFSPHATCPLPPEGNRLAVAIEAGEKTPRK